MFLTIECDTQYRIILIEVSQGIYKEKKNNNLEKKYCTYLRTQIARIFCV